LLTQKFTAANLPEVAAHVGDLATREEAKAASYRKKGDADRARTRAEAFREVQDILTNTTLAGAK
jgi:hypothetical protein